jgi:cytoskeletal protein CcmA (bactofilin family)
MRNTTIDGVGSLYGGSYDEVSINGVGKLKDDIKANIINVNGVFKSKGRIEAGSFISDGVSRVHNDIKVKELKVDGVLKARCRKVEADSICCDGIMICSGEVSADNIDIDGQCSISELYGDKVNIKFDLKTGSNAGISKYFKPFVNSYFGRPVSSSHSLVDTIECTDLEASHLKAKSIKAKNVTLGPDCIVDYLECDGNLEVHPSCKIGKTNRDIKTEAQAKRNDRDETTETIDAIDRIIEDKSLDKTDTRVVEIIKKYQDGNLDLSEVKLMLDALSTSTK